MKDNQSLKPCPFCGGEAEYVKFTDYDADPDSMERHGIRCWRHVDYIGIHAGTLSDAIAAWNRRVPPPGFEEMREALRAIAYKRPGGPMPKRVDGVILEEIEKIALAALKLTEE